MIERERIAAALPDYEIGRELGRSQWSVVLEARHRQLNRDVAVKRLPEILVAQPEVRARFRTEAQVLARLDHPHIVRVHDFVEKDDLCLIVMEKVSGGTVWDLFEGGGVSADDACAIAVATCAALDHAHGEGVLHRDIKPDNLMMSGDGVLKVTDFGIAKVLGGAATLATRAGTATGTPAYMAPEQAADAPLTPAADVYSTAVVLYELLCGRLPFSSEGGALTVMYRHVHDKPRPLGELVPDLPGPVVDVVMHALETSPADRYATPADLGTALVQAGAEAWGAEWLEHTGVRVMLPGSTRPVSAAPAVGPVTALPLMRPRKAGRPHVGVATADPEDLRPIGDLLPRPRVLPARLAASVLLATSAAFAFLGPVRSPTVVGVEPGTITVNGVDPATTEVVPLDLDAPVLLALPDSGSPVSRVRLSLSVLGREIAHADAPVGPLDDGSIGAAVDLGGSLRLAVGRLRAEVDLTGNGTAQTASFPVRLAVPWFVTVPGGVVIALLLFVVAYAESFLRALRSGSGGRAASVGTAVAGGVLGGGFVALAGLTATREPTWVALVVCALGGVGAGVAAAAAGRRRALLRHQG